MADSGIASALPIGGTGVCWLPATGCAIGVLTVATAEDASSGRHWSREVCSTWRAASLLVRFIRLQS